jgi:hypothetical protein
MKTNLIETRQIRIFISSTFRDMMAERDHLIHKVFPELRRYCAEREEPPGVYLAVAGRDSDTDGTETMAVNYLSLSIWNEEKKKETYHNEWITNKPVNAYTVEHLAACAGAVEDRERAQ